MAATKLKEPKDVLSFDDSEDSAPIHYSVHPSSVNVSIDFLKSRGVYFELMPAVIVSQSSFTAFCPLTNGVRHIAVTEDPGSTTVHGNPGDRYYGATPGLYTLSNAAVLPTAVDFREFHRRLVVFSMTSFTTMSTFELVDLQHRFYAWYFVNAASSRRNVYVFPDNLDYVELRRSGWNGAAPSFQVFKPVTLRLVWLRVVSHVFLSIP